MMLMRAGLSKLSLPIFRVFKPQLPFLEPSRMCMINYDGDADDIHGLLTPVPNQITVLKNFLTFGNMCHNVPDCVQ